MREIFSMIKMKIDNLEILIKPNLSILEACKYIGINIPKFCYHENLSIAGNCRMCLIELQKTPKPVASCAMPIVNNMVVFTTTPQIKKARENVLETLLINHPLDCPICDQGGECDLQDETKNFGVDLSRFFLKKRNVEDKNFGSTIKTIMTRCIHCTRCVRFSSEIAGSDVFGTINRGTATEISNYVSKPFDSFLSGNVIDLCPVGALTSKNYAFKARPWELKTIETIDLTDNSGTTIYLNFKESEIVRILPKINKDINENWISDRIRFSFDSFTNSRLHSIFEKQSNTKFVKVNWNFIFAKFKANLLNDESVFLINNEIDLHSLTLLKKLSYTSKKRISILTTDVIESSNFYISFFVNKLVDIKKSKTCFLFFINTFTENIVINTRLKIKHNQQRFHIFNFGNLFKASFPINFSNISITNFINFFESKNKIVSKALVTLSSPLIIFSDKLKTRLSCNFHLISMLKKIIATSIILNVSHKCNTDSLSLLNINLYNSKNLKKSKVLISINLDDITCVRKLIDISKQNFWLNSYGSLIASKTNYILPVLNTLETSNIFLNLEQKPQRTATIFSKIGDAKSVKLILKHLLKFVLINESLKNLSYRYKAFSFLEEFLMNTPVFRKIKNIVFSSVYLKLNNCFQNQILYSKYPMKSNIEDFFLVNSFCKHSLVLNDLSRSYRETNKKINY